MDKKIIEISKEYLLTTVKVKETMSKAFNLSNKEEIMRFRNTMAKGDFYFDYMKHSLGIVAIIMILT